LIIAIKAKPTPRTGFWLFRAKPGFRGCDNLHEWPPAIRRGEADRVAPGRNIRRLARSFICGFRMTPRGLPPSPCWAIRGGEASRAAQGCMNPRRR